MKILLTLLLSGLAVLNSAFCQEAVFFYNSDSSRIRADLYSQNPEWPFIIICRDNQNPAHFSQFARRMINLNYNCLLLELQQGNSLKSKNDIQAAISFTQKIVKKQVILCGSTYAASLCLLSSAGNSQVKAIIAMSPGEFYLPFISLTEEINKIRQPVFVSSSTMEYSYIQKIFDQAPTGTVTLFKPEKAKGISQGMDAFFTAGPAGNEYWFALALFFKKIEN